MTNNDKGIKALADSLINYKDGASDTWRRYIHINNKIAQYTNGCDELPDKLRGTLKEMDETLSSRNPTQIDEYTVGTLSVILHNLQLNYELPL